MKNGSFIGSPIIIMRNRPRRSFSALFLIMAATVLFEDINLDNTMPYITSSER